MSNPRAISPAPVAQRDIVLTTFDARWIHASFGLRYLRANLGALESRSEILEFTTTTWPLDALEAILARAPRIVGVGVYIWNAVESLALVKLLRRVAPEITVVLGGPEVSHETAEQEIAQLAHYVVQGEGDLAFASLCEAILEGRPPADKIVASQPPPIETLQFPYRLYDAHDLAHRVIYVEASRGCPFRCEFCLSSLDRSVRAFDLDALVEQLADLWDRGARQFKFVDRTFNLREDTTTRLLNFFLERAADGVFAHFEMVPDRLPEGLRELIRQFPPGTLQFEVGIQTFEPAVAKRIQRRQNYEKLADNLRFLREETGVHVHADLIVGLPGESPETFADGFDHLVALAPQEIQVGILKRLRGTPIVRWDEEFEVVWSPDPPYELVANRLFDFAMMQRMRRFSRYWDLVGNSGRFRATLPHLWSQSTPFHGFLGFADWLWETTGATSKLSPMRLNALLFRYLGQSLAPEQFGPALAADWSRMGRHDVPAYLHPWGDIAVRDADAPQAEAPARQSRFVRPA